MIMKASGAEEDEELDDIDEVECEDEVGETTESA